MTRENLIEEIESEVTRLKRLEHKQAHEINELSHEHEKAIDSLCTQLLSVLDSLNRADMRSSEKYPNNEAVNATRKRFSTSEKKLLTILEEYQVQEITFPNGKFIENDCQIVDTAPDPEKEDDTILSIEKRGFRRCGRLLRLADVKVVKN